MLIKLSQSMLFVRNAIDTGQCCICIIALCVLACCDNASAQCNCGSQGATVVQPGNYGVVSGQTYYASPVSQSYRGYESRSGVAQFTYYKTPVGSARGIPGQTVPVQTMVANFAPPTKLTGSSRPSTPSRRVYRQPLFRRW